MNNSRFFPEIYPLLLDILNEINAVLKNFNSIQKTKKCKEITTYVNNFINRTNCEILLLDLKAKKKAIKDNVDISKNNVHYDTRIIAYGERIKLLNIDIQSAKDSIEKSNEIQKELREIDPSIVEKLSICKYICTDTLSYIDTSYFNFKLNHIYSKYIPSDETDQRNPFRPITDNTNYDSDETYVASTNEHDAQIF
ncbi:hypothetical protein [Neodiprion sertifer nucleopolyhedrovirus]|uniref:Uncharacterized protein n=1 Tax=Neodiprion sertifer nucleopolyhedrovirus TaxID=111874 RepID=Q6JKF8_9CBAC|nr:hypothetical protein NeseNPV_gp02 [Neodiprion sertifer nucleopolyhedrovirus]AAQ96379.1 hypothetical protein [Neodiprion sertifer nucleopolyhedrovirus]